MSFYDRPIYVITDHVKKRFQERYENKLTLSEIDNILFKMLDNTYEGEKLENGDRKLVSFDCSSTYFIVTKDNVVKTFIKSK